MKKADALAFASASANVRSVNNLKRGNPEMKTTMLTLLIASGMIAATAANAADVYQGGGLKDAPYTPDKFVATGLYIKGDLGIANGDRDIRQDIRTGKNYLYETNEEGEVLGECWGDYKRENVTKIECQDRLGDGFEEDDFRPHPVHQTEYDDGLFSLGDSIYTDLLKVPFSDDFSTAVFGAEVSYMQQIPNSRFILEGGLGVTFYGGNKTTFDFGPSAGTIQSTDGVVGEIYRGEDDLNRFVEHTGTTSFERDYDIDLILRGHYLVTDRLTIHGGAGISWARASAKTAHTTDYDAGGPAEGVFDNSFKDTDTSIGPVLVAGLTYWATDRITIGAEYSYKNHEFDFGDSKTTDSQYRYEHDHRTVYRYNVSDDISVEDDVHAVKARIGIKLN